MSNKPIVKMFGRFFWFMFFSAVIIASSVLMYEFGPEQKVYKDTSFNYAFQPPQGYTEWESNQNAILDQHSHTLYSDGVLTVEQNILWHIAQGYNVTVFTDHDNIKNKDDIDALKEKYASKIILIQGIEWTTYRIHMNFLGITEWNLPIPNEPTDADIKAAINEAHRQKAVVTVNHIPWSLRVGMDTHPTRKELLDWGVDYIELVNQHEYDIDSVPWINASGFGKITGTDMHSPEKVCGWTGLNITNFTEAAVMNELRARRTSIFFNQTGSPDASISYDNQWYEVAKPMMLVGRMFELYYPNYIDWVGIGVFAAYLIAIFLLSEGIRSLNRKFWEKRNKTEEDNIS
jgi:hypothetical protein